MIEIWTCKDARKAAKLLIGFGVPEEEVWAALDLPRAKLLEMIHNNGLQDRLPFMRSAYEITEASE